MLEVHYTRAFVENLALFVELMSIMVFAAELAVSLAKNRLYAWEMKKERVSSLLLADDLFEVGCNQVFQKLLPVDSGDRLPCAVVVGDVSRVLCQYVANDLPHRIVSLLFQGIVYLHDSLFSHRLVQLHHLMHRIPQNAKNANRINRCPVQLYSQYIHGRFVHRYMVFFY